LILAWRHGLAARAVADFSAILYNCSKKMGSDNLFQVAGEGLTISGRKPNGGKIA